MLLQIKDMIIFAVRTLIKKAEKTPIIPRRANAVFPGLQDIYKPYYRTPSAIERFLSRIKENKRLALRYDKLAAIKIFWINLLNSTIPTLKELTLLLSMRAEP